MTTLKPEWLKAELFEDLLNQNFSDFKQIKNFDVKPALSSGENYATIMLRIEIEFEVLTVADLKTETFVIKLPVQNELFNELLKQRNIFDCETRMYSEVIPELEEMYQKAGLEVRFGAKSYKLAVAENYVLLEDLKRKEFRNAPRLNGLDKPHMQQVLTKLAQWHAATATRVATKGLYEPQSLMTQSMFTADQRPLVEQMLKGTIEPFMAGMERRPDNEQMLEALKTTFENLAHILFKDLVNDAEFNVLNHGDFWMNNIMFQYNETGHIKETYIVDFQTPKYGSPAQDLLYLLISSTQYELKVKNFDYFILYYHEQLVQFLKLLNYPKKLPTLKDIHIALLRHSSWGVLPILGTMAAVNLENTVGADLDNYLSESAEGVEFKKQLFSNARFRKHVDIVLPWLYNRGALDCA